MKTTLFVTQEEHSAFLKGMRVYSLSDLSLEEQRLFHRVNALVGAAGEEVQLQLRPEGQWLHARHQDADATMYCWDSIPGHRFEAGGLVKEVKCTNTCSAPCVGTHARRR